MIWLIFFAHSAGDAFWFETSCIAVLVVIIWACENNSIPLLSIYLHCKWSARFFFSCESNYDWKSKEWSTKGIWQQHQYQMQRTQLRKWWKCVYIFCIHLWRDGDTISSLDPTWSEQIQLVNDIQNTSSLCDAKLFFGLAQKFILQMHGKHILFNHFPQTMFSSGVSPGRHRDRERER